MNRNRKNRLNLSLVRKSESPKSPVQDRSSVTEVTSECNTPLNSRKRSSTFSDGSPVMNDYDSPILMSQDTSNLVTGVSWAWNSPKRSIPEECRRPRPLLASNNILPPKEPDLRKQTTERLVGFYKFQMELQKIQLEAQQNADKECQKKVEVKPPSPKSPNGSDLFDSFGETDTNGDPPTNVVVADEPPLNPPYLAQIDSFNDSAFDSLLLQASQAAEKKSENALDAATASNEGSDSTPVKRKSFFKSRTINDLDSIAVNDLLNDSTDFCLIEASQMVEGNLNNLDNKTTAEPSSSKKTNSLTRHKSLPASPSQKVTKNPEEPSLRSKFDANFLNSDSSSRAATSRDLTSSSAQPVRLCTKEEIEQKRQEALKRQQARRLNRLGGLGNTVLNNNHLAKAARKS